MPITIEQYLQAREGRVWTMADTTHITDVLRDITKLAQDAHKYQICQYHARTVELKQRISAAVGLLGDIESELIG